jgi:hypothetical protein
VDPQLLRGGFRIGFFIAAIALATLPFQPRDSAEFVVTMIAAIIGGAFMFGIWLLARAANPPHPRNTLAPKDPSERSTTTGREG